MGRMVVTFGGNALVLPGEKGGWAEQLEHARLAAAPLAERVVSGTSIIVVHGNGPQLGLDLERAWAARDRFAMARIDEAVAATEGAMGALLELAFREELRRLGAEAEVSAVVTLVEVDPGDPGFLRPEKPVGPFYSADEAAELSRSRGVPFVEDAGRGYRRVVPSPRPMQLVDARAMCRLLEGDAAGPVGRVVISGGGGGVPVVRGPAGELTGAEAVIDKDFTATLVALELGATHILSLTGVDAVYRGFRSERRTPIPLLTAAEAERLLHAGEFPPGSMGPKIEAALAFLAGGGAEVVITSLPAAGAALAGQAGTRIVP